jgi:hypothetical protein
MHRRRGRAPILCTFRQWRRRGRTALGNSAIGLKTFYSNLVSRRMCNLYSITTNQAAIAAPFRVVNRYVGTRRKQVRLPRQKLDKT